jgi:hypothetical protein
MTWRQKVNRIGKPAKYKARAISASAPIMRAHLLKEDQPALAGQRWRRVDETDVHDGTWLFLRAEDHDWGWSIEMMLTCPIGKGLNTGKSTWKRVE